MDLWKNILASVAARTNESTFQTWFNPIKFVSRDEKSIRICVPNSYFRNAFLEKFSSLFQGLFDEMDMGTLQLQLIVEDESSPRSSLATISNNPAEKPAGLGLSINLNPKYTFDTFVIGTSNEFAHAASCAVSQKPANAYNPLYIYGGVGLGKTHLMHAIGHFLIRKNPHLRLVYVPAEKFTNDLISSIRLEKTSQFRETYRNIDVLLMDDIQFLAGKERTQEEFFHTFNSLYDAQKQIVITSDCPPKEIPTLEERLLSRFDWGLIVDIQPPDVETKVAILKKKSLEARIDLPDEVAFFVAHHIKSNVRELEGTLNRLRGLSSLTGSQIDLAFAEEVLSGIVQSGRKNLTTEIILRAVADHFRMKPSTLKEKNNSRDVAIPRQIAMYLCKELAQISLPSIGKTFGGKHHTTVLHSVRKIAAVRKKDREIDDLIQRISSKFR